MNVSSLKNRTDFIFNKFNGEIVDRGNYMVVRTPDNPNYYWGNYLIFNQAPGMGDYQNWVEIFNREFSDYDKVDHHIFTWESDTASSTCREFINEGFDLEEGIMLATDDVIFPQKYNSDIEVRPVSCDKEWQAVHELHYQLSPPEFLNDEFDDFKTKHLKQYRKMAEAGMGRWFGAWLGDTLVGDLGLFFEGKIGRYQNVGTHPDFRRQGVCQTLVYETGKIALDVFGVTNLVMEADANYHAAQIYETVGFRPRERSFDLTRFAN